MSLRALRTQLTRLAEEIRADTVDRVSVVIIDVVDAREGGESPPCAGHYCDAYLAGQRRRLFFPGQDPAPVAKALFDHVHRIERAGEIRPVPVLMPAQAAPDDALSIEQPPEGIPLSEHVARIYDALRCPHG